MVLPFRSDLPCAGNPTFDRGVNRMLKTIDGVFHVRAWRPPWSVLHDGEFFRAAYMPLRVGLETWTISL